MESLSFSPAEITRYVGDAPAAVPMPTISPEDAGNKKLAWTSDKEEVAKVVDGQLIIGTKGTAQLTAAATDGSNQKAQLTVHVRYRVEGVKLYQGTEEVSSITLTEGEAITLAAKVAPDNVPNGVEWEFQEGEFSVKDKTSEKATFTALKAGDYTITAKAVEDNEKSATVTVKVLPKVARLTLHEKDKTEEIGDAVTFEVGESKTFEVKQLPAEALPLPVSWSVTVGGKPTDDVTVADGVVTVKKWVEGCTLTVQVKVSESETVKKDVTLTVLKPAPKEIKLEPKELTLAAGETKEVTISFVGEAPLDEGVTIEPATSEYFTFKQEGKKLSITGTKPTTEPVTVKVTSTKNTAVFQTCQVTVTKNSETFEVTLTQPEHGTLAIEGYTTETLKAVAKGTELKVKATPKNEGGVAYELKELKANGVDIKGTMKFIVTAATTVTARFEKKQGGEDNKDKDKDPKKPNAVEDAVLASLSVAPNPFTAQLRILNPEGIVGRYELVNQMGAVLRSGVIAGDDALVVDTEALPAGLYFVRLAAQGGARKTLKVYRN